MTSTKVDIESPANIGRGERRNQVAARGERMGFWEIHLMHIEGKRNGLRLTWVRQRKAHYPMAVRKANLRVNEAVESASRLQKRRAKNAARVHAHQWESKRGPKERWYRPG